MQVKLLTNVVKRPAVVDVRAIYSLSPSWYESESRDAVATQSHLENQIPIVGDLHLFTPTRKDRTTASHQRR